MAKKQYFENLLGAMQESILKAHSMIENQHLNVMKRYFDESQKPLTFDIQYPRINPDTGELEYVLGIQSKARPCRCNCACCGNLRWYR